MNKETAEGILALSPFFWERYDEKERKKMVQDFINTYDDVDFPLPQIRFESKKRSEKCQNR